MVVTVTVLLLLVSLICTILSAREPHFPILQFAVLFLIVAVALLVLPR